MKERGQNGTSGTAVQYTEEQLRERVSELEDTLRAIRNGEVDALIDGAAIFSLESAESESNRFRGQVLDQISDVVIAVDHEYHITYLNEAAEKQYGARAADVLGHRLRSLYEYHWVDPADEAVAMTALREKGIWRGENIHVKRNGDRVHVESVVKLLRDPDGVVI